MVPPDRYADCLFPIFIAVLVPLRIYSLPKIFGRSYVDLLDADGQARGRAPDVFGMSSARNVASM